MNHKSYPTGNNGNPLHARMNRQQNKLRIQCDLMHHTNVSNEPYHEIIIRLLKISR